MITCENCGIGWLINSLKHEIYAHRRRAEKARRRAERLHEPYSGYCRRMAEAYANASVEFEAELQKAQFESASVRGIDARTWVKP
jgi:hypothetical protein